MTRHSLYRPAATDLSCDLLVVGGGIVGLWLARFAVAAGLCVILCDRQRIGSGASGGFLGALMPHTPERWNAKKQFQFEALVAMEDRIRELEAETGRITGYRRTGRILPLQRPHHRVLAAERRDCAAEVWRSETIEFEWRLLNAPPRHDWPALAAMPEGAVVETLAARVDPRALVDALHSALAAADRVTLIENDGLARWESGMAVLDQGRRVRAANVAVTAGFESFPLLAQHAPGVTSLGQPVKGQAALFRAEGACDLPLVFHEGIYVVPHDNGLVAVGSTSENEFAAPFETDGKLDDVIARAVALCPSLAGCEPVERWAGLRPKAVGRDPMLGRMPDAPEVIAATGGFKITLGIAHKMAEAVVGLVTGGNDVRVPESFAVEAHLAKAMRAID